MNNYSYDWSETTKSFPTDCLAAVRTVTIIDLGRSQTKEPIPSHIAQCICWKLFHMAHT